MNAYLQDEREVKGYVEIEYSNIDNTLPVGANVMYPTQAPISKFIDSDNKKVSQNYASLEEDYFLLDGSFVLPYKPENETTYYNTNSGYITADTVEYIASTFAISFSDISKTMNGMTIYLKDNIPGTVTFTFNNTLEYEFTDNTKDILSVKFDEPLTVTSIRIDVGDFEYTNRRFRMSYIDFGLSDILRDDNLIDFDVIENIGDLNLEFPTNQLVVRLYDEEDLFDINNPSGYADFLNNGETVTLKPHIGILTQTEGIKYNDDMATFYLQNWSNNKNEITLNCIDYLEMLKNIKKADRYGDIQLTEANCEGLDVALEDTINLPVNTFKNFANNSHYICDWYIDTSNTFDYLQQLMIWLWGYLYNENNKIIINDRDNSAVYDYTLTLNHNLLDDPVYTLRDKIKSITITKYTGYYTDLDISQWQEANVIYLTNSEKAYNEQPEIVELDNYHELHLEARNVSMDIGINRVFDASEYCPAVISPPTNMTFYDFGTCTFKTETYKQTFNSTGKEITIDNKFFLPLTNVSDYDSLDTICEDLCNKINDENKKYNVSINYTGDPNIKPNMIVPIETQYGNKQVKVLKHTLTFNGGLTGSIEGVGD